MLNIIFGIIIDTFSAMREVTESKAADMKSTCFICGNDRATMDRSGSGFEQHIAREHNMWQYLYYIVYLQEKDPTDYTGLETYVTSSHVALLSMEGLIFKLFSGMCLR